MAAYAEGTGVSVQRSMNELENLVRKYGADSFAAGWDSGAGLTRVRFGISGRIVQLDVVKPSWEEFRRTPLNKTRTRESAEKFAVDEEKRRWRATVLMVKALLVAVTEQVTTVDKAFLSYLVIPSTGTTMGEEFLPQLDYLYQSNHIPPVLPGYAPRALTPGA